MKAPEVLVKYSTVKEVCDHLKKETKDLAPKKLSESRKKQLAKHLKTKRLRDAFMLHSSNTVADTQIKLWRGAQKISKFTRKCLESLEELAEGEKYVLGLGEGGGATVAKKKAAPAKKKSKKAEQPKKKDTEEEEVVPSSDSEVDEKKK